MTLTFWPEEPEARPQSSWALFAGGNEKHDTRAWLRTLGVEATPVKTAADLKRTAANVLVIAREALDAAPLPLDAADVARGLRVLVLEQNPAALESVGLRIQDIVTRHAFPRDRSHPALSGLAAADLANWRGEPDLLPKTKAGMKPWPLARPPHWGNQGAVASVVIETPAHGAFTPLADAEYDLACSPLLEWRHGRGGVLFCQFDITGRTAPEPAARRLAQNLVRALDAPYPVNNNKLVRYAGDDAGWAYASALGFAAERINIAAAAAPLEPRTDLLVIGPGAWKTCREKADTFAAAGGAVLVLAQPGADLAPAHLKTAPVKTARVAPEARPPALLRGIGPQLLNWRAFLAQERFDRSGQPDGARVYLDGLVLEQPRTAGNANDANGANDAGGRLVFSQLDWRALEAAEDNGGGGKNLEKPRWHTVQFYRQLLTNLGARTANDAAAVLFTPRRVAPLVNVPVWRVFNDVAQVEPVQKDGTFPALARRFPMETAATASATAATAATADATADDRAISANIGEGEVNETGLTVASSKAGWRTYGPRGSTGRVHLDWISPAQPGKIGYARTHVYSSRPREALFAVGGDNWMVFRINGQAFVDHSKQQRAARTPFSGEFRFKAPLKAGWNLLEAKVASGSGGFGFWAMVSDPGDAHFKTNPNQGGRPENITTPPPGDLRSEPEIEAREWFYVRPLKPEDDPYRFNPW
jgi:beta-galactosidase